MASGERRLGQSEARIVFFFSEWENEQLDKNFPWSRLRRVDHFDHDGVLTGRVVDACLMLLGDIFAGRHLDGKTREACDDSPGKLVTVAGDTACNAIARAV